MEQRICQSVIPPLSDIKTSFTPNQSIVAGGFTILKSILNRLKNGNNHQQANATKSKRAWCGPKALADGPLFFSPSPALALGISSFCVHAPTPNRWCRTFHQCPLSLSLSLASSGATFPPSTTTTCGRTCVSAVRIKSFSASTWLAPLSHSPCPLLTHLPVL